MKWIVAVALLLSNLAVLAQDREFKPFKVDFGSSYADPTSRFLTSAYGACIYLHPHYRLTDDWSLGFRFEFALFKDGQEYLKNTDLILDFVNSFSPTIEYYLSRKNFRPFVGLGAGLFSETIRDMYGVFDTVSSNYKTINTLGGFSEVGFEWRNFRLSIEYNVFGSLNKNYAAFKLSTFIGGGRKKQKR